MQRAALLVAGTSLIAALPSWARSRKLVGVPGWTSGSQTHLRSRPGDKSPSVAKVPRRTKVYVWGTFRGWYRVETSDQVFGWVHHSVLKAPKARKVSELSHRKAISASNRTAYQVSDSPDRIQRRVALRGTRNPRSSTRTVAVRRTRTTPIVRVASKRKVQPFRNIRIRESVQPVRTRTVRIKTAPVQPIPVQSNVVQPNVVQSIPVQPIPVETEAARAERLRLTQQQTEQLLAARAAAQEKAARLEQQRLAQARADAKLQIVAHQARLAQRKLNYEVRLAQQEKERQERAASYKWRLARAQERAAARRQARVATYRARAAARQRRLTLRQQNNRWRQERLAMQRQQLRQTLSAQASARLNVPSTNAAAQAPVQAPVVPLHPLSPAEVLRAREEYLNNHRGTQSGAASNGAISSPLNGASSASGITFNNSSFTARHTTNMTPTTLSFGPSNTTTTPTGTSMLTLPTIPLINPLNVNPLTIRPLTTLQTKAPLRLASRGGVRGGSPAMRYINRGGSPRDYMNRRPQGSLFGQTFARQALAYRGRPYIMGAASPSRGFDCSGLIYFLLRQRGYNPPRTAAGLSRYGVSVPRNQLQAGDILLFSNTYKRGISHVGIYMGNNNFVHAANRRRGVSTSSLGERYYGSKYWGAR
ncbi:MAG TPA: NlpC/P60 family protein, partial [Abditibacteriaceae bacterium]|nr:NlpC/P60 family protein [Abditibacteriaceae bacterium]